MDGQLYLSASLLTTLSLELVKFVWRKWVIGVPDFDFPALFYELMLPFLAATWSIVLGLVGWATPVVFEWQSLLQWAITIAVSLALYYMTVKPTKEYSKLLKANG
jgi:hypothetical protein